jgi:Fe-S-cluster containining protein
MTGRSGSPSDKEHDVPQPEEKVPVGETFRIELQRLYTELDQAIALASPVCRSSGRCCRFKEYGHTLFLSQPEADLLLEPGLPPGSTVDADSCPFQIGGLCTARERRPMGCRIYYCDPTYQDRQGEIAEEFIARLKGLHDRWGEAWRYRPLVEFLREIPNPPPPLGKPGELVVLGEKS